MAAVTEPTTVGETIRTVPALVDMARELEQHAGAPRDRSAPPPPIDDTWLQRHVAAMVPRRFQRVTFDSFEPKTNSQRVALGAVQTFCAQALANKGCMLALIGKQGTGKSHLLYAAALHVLAMLGAQNASQFYARPWYRLADELRYGGETPFGATVHHEPKDVRARLWSKRVVLLDEVRPTAGTAFDDMELTKFACHAYDNELAVLITTNVSPLADVMGPAAASRFVQLTIDGPDHRQQ